MDSSEEDEIHLRNLQDGDLIQHSIVLLKGYISNVRTVKSLQIYLNHKLQLFGKTEFYDTGTRTLHFKCIIELKKNKNCLFIRYNNDLSNNLKHHVQKISSQSATEIHNSSFKTGQRISNEIQSSHDFCQNCLRILNEGKPIDDHQENLKDSETLINVYEYLANNNLNTTQQGCEEQSDPLFRHKTKTKENQKYYNTKTEDCFDTIAHERKISNNLNSNPQLVELSSALDCMDINDSSSVNNFNKTLYNENTRDNELPSTKCFTLYFIPRSTHLVVTPVYIIPQYHDGRFQALEGPDNSIENACKKIVLGVKVIQCLMAMLLRGHKTFQMEYEEPSNKDSTEPDKSQYINECLVFHSALTVDQVNNFSQDQLWEYFGRELMMSKYGSPNKKFVAFLSCTHWTGERVLAHAAIGGGGLALFGTGCLHTWPSHVEEIVHCFLNTTPVNTQLMMDDSCNRGTYGGCYSTTLGSVCHEMGHTFDLGHSRHGIMGRGFDSIDSLFTLRPNGTMGKEIHSSDFGEHWTTRERNGEKIVHIKQKSVKNNEMKNSTNKNHNTNWSHIDNSADMCVKNINLINRNQNKTTNINRSNAISKTNKKYKNTNSTIDNNQNKARSTLSKNINCPGFKQHSHNTLDNEHVINVDFIPNSSDNPGLLENKNVNSNALRSHSSERIIGPIDNNKTEANGRIQPNCDLSMVENRNHTNYAFLGGNNTSQNHLRRSISQGLSPASVTEDGGRLVLCGFGSEADRGSKDRSENPSEVQCSVRNEEEIFWSENCAVMLNYHRWFNSYSDKQLEGDSQISDLKFDARRNTVTSSAGLRLIELRGPQGLALHFWSFASARQCFILPVQRLRAAHTLAAMDRAGYVLKIELG